MSFGNKVQVVWREHATLIYWNGVLIVSVSVKRHKVTWHDASEKPDAVQKSIDSAISWAQCL